MRYEINLDPYPENPREECDYAGRMVCWHRRYSLGDEQPNCHPTEKLRELAGDLVNAPYPDLIPDEHIHRILEKHTVMFPLYLYDHSGITISTSPFRCPWDSGWVGFIYMPRETIDDEFGGDETRAEDCLQAEVREYDNYLRGEIYGYAIFDDEDEVVESCCGIDSYAAAEEEAIHAMRSYEPAGR